MIKKLCAIITLLSFAHVSFGAPCVQGALELAAQIQAVGAVVTFAGASDDPFNLRLPSALGRVTGGRISGQGPVVINIQDLHCHAEVQRNISGILQFLDTKYGLRDVFVEGGYGRLNTAWLDGIADPGLRKQMVNALLENGRLGGSEYYAITNGRHDLLTGLEDERLHKANIVRLGNILERQPRFEAKLRELRRDLVVMKARYLSAENKRLDNILAKYRAGEMTDARLYALLSAYIDKVSARPDAYHCLQVLRKESFPTVQLYRETLTLQKRLRYPKVSAQLTAFMGMLKTRLSFAAYNDLLTSTNNLNDLGALATALGRLSRDHQINIGARYPDLAQFIAYRERSRAVNPMVLLRETRRMTDALRSAFAQNSAERDIAFLSDTFDCFEDYLLNRLTAEDYAYFKPRFEQFTSVWGAYTYTNHIRDLASDFQLLDAYYAVNDRRNGVFIDTMAPLLRPRAGGPKDAAVPDIIVMVSGGFHTDGIARLLTESGISYCTVTPAITRPADAARHVFEETIRYQSRLFGAQALNGTPLGSLTQRVDVTPAGGITLTLEGGARFIVDGDSFRVEGDIDASNVIATDRGLDFAEVHQSARFILHNAGIVARLVLTHQTPLSIVPALYALVDIFGDMLARKGAAGTGLLWDIASNPAVQQALADEGTSLDSISTWLEPLQALAAGYAVTQADLRALRDDPARNSIVRAVLRVPYAIETLGALHVFKGSVGADEYSNLGEAVDRLVQIRDSSAQTDDTVAYTAVLDKDGNTRFTGDTWPDSAATIILFNSARANRPGVSSQPSDTLDPDTIVASDSVQKLYPSKQAASSLVRWISEEGTPWYVKPNDFPQWRGGANYLVFARADTTPDGIDASVGQAEMSSLQNIRDVLEFQHALNESLPVDAPRYTTGFNGWFYDRTTGAVRAGATQNWAHAQLFRQFLPIANAATRRVGTLADGVDVGVLAEEGLGSAVVLEADAKNREAIAAAMHTLIRSITAQGHSFNYLVIPSGKRLRVFVFDRVLTRLPGFDDEAGFIEVAGMMPFSDPAKFFALDPGEEVDRAHLAAWARARAASGTPRLNEEAFRKTRAALPQLTALRPAVESLAYGLVVQQVIEANYGIVVDEIRSLADWTPTGIPPMLVHGADGKQYVCRKIDGVFGKTLHRAREVIKYQQLLSGRGIAVARIHKTLNKKDPFIARSGDGCYILEDYYVGEEESDKSTLYRMLNREASGPEKADRRREVMKWQLAAQLQNAVAGANLQIKSQHPPLEEGVANLNTAMDDLRGEISRQYSAGSREQQFSDAISEVFYRQYARVPKNGLGELPASPIHGHMHLNSMKFDTAGNLTLLTNLEDVQQARRINEFINLLMPFDTVPNYQNFVTLITAYQAELEDKLSVEEILAIAQVVRFRLLHDIVKYFHKYDVLNNPAYENNRAVIMQAIQERLNGCVKFLDEFENNKEALISALSHSADSPESGYTTAPEFSHHRADRDFGNARPGTALTLPSTYRLAAWIANKRGKAFAERLPDDWYAPANIGQYKEMSRYAEQVVAPLAVWDLPVHVVRALWEIIHGREVKKNLIRTAGAVAILSATAGLILFAGGFIPVHAWTDMLSSVAGLISYAGLHWGYNRLFGTGTRVNVPLTFDGLEQAGADDTLRSYVEESGFRESLRSYAIYDIDSAMIDTSEDLISVLKKRSKGVLTINEFARTHFQDVRGGYALGLTGSSSIYHVLSKLFGLASWETGYQETGIDAGFGLEHISQYLDRITSTGKPVVFFVPSHMNTRYGYITQAELRWMAQNPGTLDNVYFVFGAYDHYFPATIPGTKLGSIYDMFKHATNDILRGRSPQEMEAALENIHANYVLADERAARAGAVHPLPDDQQIDRFVDMLAQRAAVLSQKSARHNIQQTAATSVPSAVNQSDDEFEATIRVLTVLAEKKYINTFPAKDAERALTDQASLDSLAAALGLHSLLRNSLARDAEVRRVGPPAGTSAGTRKNTRLTSDEIRFLLKKENPFYNADWLDTLVTEARAAGMRVDAPLRRANVVVALTRYQDKNEDYENKERDAIETAVLHNPDVENAAEDECLFINILIVETIVDTLEETKLTQRTLICKKSMLGIEDIYGRNMFILPQDDILFNCELTFKPMVTAIVVGVDFIGIHPKLEGKRLISRVYPLLVSFLSKHLPGQPMYADSVRPETTHLVKKHFNNVVITHINKSGTEKLKGIIPPGILPKNLSRVQERINQLILENQKRSEAKQWSDNRIESMAARDVARRERLISIVPWFAWLHPRGARGGAGLVTASFWGTTLAVGALAVGVAHTVMLPGIGLFLALVAGVAAGFAVREAVHVNIDVHFIRAAGLVSAVRAWGGVDITGDTLSAPVWMTHDGNLTDFCRTVGVTPVPLSVYVRVNNLDEASLQVYAVVTREGYVVLGFAEKVLKIDPAVVTREISRALVARDGMDGNPALTARMRQVIAAAAAGSGITGLRPDAFRFAQPILVGPGSSDDKVSFREGVMVVPAQSLPADTSAARAVLTHLNQVNVSMGKHVVLDARAFAENTTEMNIEELILQTGTAALILPKEQIVAIGPQRLAELAAGGKYIYVNGDGYVGDVSLSDYVTTMHLAGYVAKDSNGVPRLYGKGAPQQCHEITGTIEEVCTLLARRVHADPSSVVIIVPNVDITQERGTGILQLPALMDALRQYLFDALEQDAAFRQSIDQIINPQNVEAILRAA